MARAQGWAKLLLRILHSVYDWNDIVTLPLSFFYQLHQYLCVPETTVPDRMIYQNVPFD